MTSVWTGVVIAVLIVCSVATGVASGTPAAYVAITGATVHPEQPLPGEPVTVTATIANQAGSPAAIELTSVTLRHEHSSGLRVLDRVATPGIVAPGGTVDIPLVGTFEHAGVYRVTVHAFGWANGSFVQVSTPVVLRVEERATPTVQVDRQPQVAGVEGSVNVSVTNRAAVPVRGIEITLSDQASNTVLGQGVIGRLQSGSSDSRSIPIRFHDPGRHSITATVTYRSSSGQSGRVVETSVVTVDPATPRVALETSQPTAAGVPALDTRVENHGNVPIEAVTIHVHPTNDSRIRRSLGTLDPGARRTVRVNLTDLPDGRVPVTVTVTYETSGRTGTERTRTHVVSRPGTVVLTGIEIVREADRIHLTGSASNVGLSPVRGVIVRSATMDGNRPDHQAYFVGTIPGSDFAPFDLAVRAPPNATAVPLKVTYLVRGEQRQQLVRVPLAHQPDDAPVDGSPIVPAITGGAVTLGVGGLLIVAWRNSRGRR